MITVMGATGNTGKKVAEKLLKGGDRVRALEVPERNQQNTTPSRFEDFAEELAQAYKAM